MTWWSCISLHQMSPVLKSLPEYLGRISMAFTQHSCMGQRSQMCHGQSGPLARGRRGGTKHQPTEEHPSVGEPLPSTRPPQQCPEAQEDWWCLSVSPPVRCKGTCEGTQPGAACEGKTLVPAREHLSQLLWDHCCQRLPLLLCSCCPRPTMGHSPQRWVSEIRDVVMEGWGRLHREKQVNIFYYPSIALSLLTILIVESEGEVYDFKYSCCES